MYRLHFPLFVPFSLLLFVHYSLSPICTLLPFSYSYSYLSLFPQFVPLPFYLFHICINFLFLSCPLVQPFSYFYLFLFLLFFRFSLSPVSSFLSSPYVFLSLFPLCDPFSLLVFVPFSFSPMCSFISFSYFSFLSLHLYQKIKLFLNLNILSLNLKYIISRPEPGLLFFDLGNNNKNNYTFRKSVS